MTSTLNREIAAHFAGALPDGWFTGPPDLAIDNEEIVVVGAVREPELAAGAGESERATANRARIARFREETREARMAIAADAERRFARKISWGATCGGERIVFTNVSVPVMTRLRQPERQVLDTLVAAGVARSRSDALNWCVRLVGQHEREWLSELAEALVHVERVRTAGPRAS